MVRKLTNPKNKKSRKKSMVSNPTDKLFYERVT